MRKAGVIYCSKTGFTRKYAEWLAEALGCEAVPYHQAAKTNWADCDTVIFASWFHAGRIQKLDWFKRLPLTGKAHRRSRHPLSGLILKMDTLLSPAEEQYR